MSTICEITEAVRRRSAHSESSIVSFFRGPSLSVAPRQPPDDENLQRSSGARNEIFGRPTHAPSSLWHSQVSSHGTRTTAAYAAACRPAAKPAGTHGKHTHTHTHTHRHTHRQPAQSLPASLPAAAARTPRRPASWPPRAPASAGRSVGRAILLSVWPLLLHPRSLFDRTNERSRARGELGRDAVGGDQSVSRYLLLATNRTVGALTYLLTLIT